MCGRFNIRTSPQEIARIFRTTGVPPNCPPRFNLAPTQDALAVRYDPDDGLRHLDLLHWGLIPLWAKDKKIAANLINARGESAADKPSFRDAFAKRRCIIPADGFYEWQKRPDGKQPFAIVPLDSPVFAFAGLWERWRDPANKEVVRSCAIITGEANDLMNPIHDRMPVILEEKDWPQWLGEADVTPVELKAMLKPFPAERMRAYPISTRVNSVKNDDEAVLVPL